MTQRTARRGTIYILVLVSSMIVTMIGLLGYKMIRAQAAVARADTQRNEAAVLAESAIQWGVHIASIKGSWREAMMSGIPYPSLNVGSGQIQTTFTDADGDLNDGDGDLFTITGTGTIGTATQTYEVTVDPGSTSAHPALSESITVGGTLAVDKGILSLESGGTAENLTLSGGKSNDSAIVDIVVPAPIPDPVLINRWASAGTLIARSDHRGVISGATFSSSSAPYGLKPDPNGIYVIDAESQSLSIDTTRVTGTLVVINLNGMSLTFMNSRLSFGDHGGPTLIVDGNMIYKSDFSSEMQQGLIYVNGIVRIYGNMILIGQFFANGKFVVDSSVAYITMNDHPSAVSGPPEGFTESGVLEIVPGSWRRIVN